MRIRFSSDVAWPAEPLWRSARTQAATALLVVALGGCAATAPVDPETAPPAPTGAPASDPTGSPTGSPTGAPISDTPNAPDAAVAAPTPPEEPTAAREFPPGTLYRLLSAEFAIRRGEPALAVSTYMEVAAETGDAGVAERATRMAVYARDQAAGLQASALWVKLADDLESHRVNAVLLVRAGKDDDAVAQLKAIVEKFDDQEGRGYQIVADLLSRERDKERRVALMEQVVAGALDDDHAKTALAQVAARSDQVDKAVALLKEVYDADPSVDKHAAFYASMLRNQGKTEEALAVLAAQVERSTDQDGQEIRLLYARFLVDAKRYEDAREQFERLAEDQPDRSDVRYALGLLLLQTNHYDEARAQFEKLLALGERTLEANFYLGQIAEAQEQKDAAIRYYREVDRGDQYLNAQVRVAAIYAGTQRMDRARQHLSAVRRESDHDDIRLYRAEAELLASHDDVEGALEVFDAALEAYPKNTDLLYARAMMSARVKRFDVLERDLRDILSREPNNADALNALGYTLADRGERIPEAYELIKRAIALKPTDHYIVDSMGWVLYRMGRLEESVTHLRHAMELKPDAEVAAHLGEVLWVLGRKDEAREVWDTALKETPEDKRLLETINRLSK